MFGSVTNRLDLAEEQLLHNLHRVQHDNGIPLDANLQWIEETIRAAGGDQNVRFANFSVEMETGTGKTYVYLRTALELNRRYGFRKFIHPIRAFRPRNERDKAACFLGTKSASLPPVATAGQSSDAIGRWM